MNSVGTDGGTAYTGNVINGLDIALSDPSVTIFPVNRVGRPLGAAAGAGPIPPGASWAFQTNGVSARGVGFAAYPAASFGD